MKYKVGDILRYVTTGSILEDDLFEIEAIRNKEYKLVRCKSKVDYGYFDDYVVEDKHYFVLNRKPQKVGW